MALSYKQRLNLSMLAFERRKRTRERIENLLSYDIDFYRFKNGRLNVSKIARCAGVSN
ncbi:hypothetical protein [Campylobacter portucalensis]|uniref:hypothetical protein n=1 Tax=Campylobacter portucalensis TaxID=2608384 RepID=UPI0018A6C79D|nr:hypothetical protein [Campylobacter portucalensis]